jgi:hypothetical protein
MEVGPVHVWQHFEKVMPLGITQWGKQKMWNAVFWGCVFLFDPWYLWHVVFFDDLIQTPWRIMLPLAQVKKEPRRRSAMWSEEGSTVDQHHEKHPWTYEKWFLGIGDPQNHRRIWMIWIICGYQHFRKPPLSGSVNWALERCSTFRRPGLWAGVSTEFERQSLGAVRRKALWLVPSIRWLFRRNGLEVISWLVTQGSS